MKEYEGLWTRKKNTQGLSLFPVMQVKIPLKGFKLVDIVL